MNKKNKIHYYLSLNYNKSFKNIICLMCCEKIYIYCFITDLHNIMVIEVGLVLDFTTVHTTVFMLH